MADSNFVRDVSSNSCSFPNRNQERVTKYNLRESYRIVSWVYACINVIAESISGVPIKFYDGPPEDDGKKEIKKDHPANKLFSPPKPMEIITREDYVKDIFINLGSMGEIFSPMDIKAGIPVNIDIAHPMLFEANKDDKGNLKSWKYTPIGKDGRSLPPRTLADGEVLQFKYYDPLNKVRGLSPLTPGRLPIEQEVNMSVWNAGFFQGGIRNPIVILLKQMLGTGPNRTNFLQQIQRDYTGFVKGHGPLVLEGGADARPLLQSIKDLDFIEGKNLTREEICALLGVPPALVGIFRYANYSNSREQVRLFWLNTLVPKMRLFRSVLQYGLLDKYWPDVYVDFDWTKVDALEADPVQKATAHNMEIAAASNMYNMGYTKTEIAEYIGDKKLIGDGKPKPPPPKPVAPKPAAPPPGTAPAAIPPGVAPGKKPQGPAGQGRPPKKTVKSIDEEIVTYDLSGEYLEEYARHYQETVLEPFAEDYMRFVKTFTKEMISEVRKGTEVDYEKWRHQWCVSIDSLITRILYAGVRTAVAELGHERMSSEPFDEKQLLAAENPGRSIEFFVNETAAKSRIIAGMIQGITSSPDAIKLLESPAATILPLMNTEEANWVVGRVFHHGKMLAQPNLGVTEHAWAAHNCPVGHDHLHGAVVTHWTEFSKDTGIHPLAMVTSAPLMACTCTTHPHAVKFSTR